MHRATSGPSLPQDAPSSIRTPGNEYQPNPSDASTPALQHLIPADQLIAVRRSILISIPVSFTPASLFVAIAKGRSRSLVQQYPLCAMKGHQLSVQFSGPCVECGRKSYL